MLRAHGLTIARGGRALLRGIDATFEPGTVTAVVGANGAGKSTLLATLCGRLAPQTGSVTLDGDDVHALAAPDRARRIALVEPLEAALAALTVAEAAGSARYPYHRWWEWQPTAADRDAVENALAATGLQPLRARELGTLSAGERQRVWIAVALAQRARVIALDEPTSHLDLRYAIETLELLRRLAADGAIVIAVLHQLEEAASFCDRAIVAGNGGILAAGTPADAFTPEIMEAAYGIAIGVERRAGGLAFHRKTQL